MSPGSSTNELAQESPRRKIRVGGSSACATLPGMTETTHVTAHPLYEDQPEGPVRDVSFHGLNPYAYDRAKAQFFTASGNDGQPEPGSPQEKVVELREAIRVLATLIDMHVPGGRHRSLAFTALEDVQMRANRGIFSPQEPGPRKDQSPEQRLAQDSSPQ